MRYDYDGKNVIVTGATGGIGKEVAKGIIAGGGRIVNVSSVAGKIGGGLLGTTAKRGTRLL